MVFCAWEWHWWTTLVYRRGNAKSKLLILAHDCILYAILECYWLTYLSASQTLLEPGEIIKQFEVAWKCAGGDAVDLDQANVTFTEAVSAKPNLFISPFHAHSLIPLVEEDKESSLGSQIHEFSFRQSSGCSNDALEPWLEQSKSLAALSQHSAPAAVLGAECHRTPEDKLRLYRYQGAC